MDHQINTSGFDVVGHVHKCMLLVSPVLYKVSISKHNVYSVLSCPYLHHCALALANGDHLLLPLGN